jgi:hypothetical protein
MCACIPTADLPFLPVPLVAVKPLGRRLALHVCSMRIGLHSHCMHAGMVHGAHAHDGQSHVHGKPMTAGLQGLHSCEAIPVPTLVPAAVVRFDALTGLAEPFLALATSLLRLRVFLLFS